MAYNQVQYVPPPPVEKKSGGKKGGGAFGAAVVGAIGGVVGGLAGAATGGPAGAAAGAMGGAAGGAGLGQMLGNAIMPAKGPSTSIERRMEAAGPQVMQSEQTQKLKQSITALHSQPDQVKQQYASPLVQAYMVSLANDNKPKGAV